MASSELDKKAASMAYRLQSAGIVVDGVPFDLKQYPYLIDLLDALGERPDIVIRKGAQMGFTVTLVLGTIELARHVYARGVLYLMPTRDDVYDFSRSRFDRMLKDNHAIFGRHVHGTDSMGIKRIGASFIYFRGAKSRSQLKSIPVDCLVTDERDEMDPAMVDLAEKRLDGSKFKHHVSLSTPTIPDHGVDLDYKRSDQRTWHIKCKACGGWTCLEFEFPKCLVRVGKGGSRRVIRACTRCSKEIHPIDGKWVAAEPDKEKMGFYISQLCSPTVKPYEILEEYEDPEVSTGDRLREFKNSRLGLAHADLEDVLTEAAIRECLGQEPSRLSAQGPCWMGVDVGKKAHHYFIGQNTGERSREILRYGTVPTFEDLHDLEQRFNVDVGVMDEMAETHAVRDFVDAHNGWYGCWYSEAQRTAYDWNYKDYRVTVNRSELLDESHRAILHKRVEFPRAGDGWKPMVDQMCNLARVTVRDDKTGTPKVRWIIRGGRKNDHLRHAFAYGWLASLMTPIAADVRRIITPAQHAQRGTTYMAE